MNMTRIKFSACIELLFTEVPFIERIHKAKQAGFNAIELWNWVDRDLKDLKNICKKNKIEIPSVPGISKSQIVNPEDMSKCIQEFKKALETAVYLNSKYIVVHVNALQMDGTAKPVSNSVSDQQKDEAILSVIYEIVPLAKKEGIVVCFEPLNTFVDHMGYYLNHSQKAFDIIRKVNSPNLKLLYDIYHMQIMEGNITSTIENNLDLIGYIHVADVPGRHEPGTGEINFKNIYKKLKEINFNGYIGFEYIPLFSTEKSLLSTKEIFEF